MIRAFLYTEQLENIFLKRYLENFIDKFKVKNKIVDTKDIEFKLNIDKKMYPLATINGVSLAQKHTLSIRSKYNRDRVWKIKYYIHTF